MSNAAKLGSKTDLWMMDRSNLIVVGHDTDDGPEHELYRADVRDPIDETLAPSIRKHGVIQPVRARRCKADPSKAEIIAGRSRVRAVGEIAAAGGPAIKVPVMLWPAGSTVAEIIGAANAENHVRKTESILVTADHAFAQLRAEGGAEVKGAINSVAVDLGISPTRVRGLLKLRGAADVVEALKAGRIGGEVAITLASLPDDLRAAELAAAVEGKATLVEVRNRVVDARARKSGKAPKARKLSITVGLDDIRELLVEAVETWPVVKDHLVFEDDTMQVVDSIHGLVGGVVALSQDRDDAELQRDRLCAVIGRNYPTLTAVVDAIVDNFKDRYAEARSS